MAFVGRTDVKDPGAQQGQWERLARRREQLYIDDEQFRITKPDEQVAAAARAPGLRIAEVMATVLQSYSSRPALGQRAREVVTDPSTGRSTLRFLPRFDTMVDGLGLRQIGEIGIDKVMWSSDYPHNESTFGYSERSLAAVVDAVGPDDAVRVVGGNIKEFLSI